MHTPTWQFAIDVGGTFTDCLAYGDDGQVLRHKLLSSGVTKGKVEAESTVSCVVDASRIGDPTDFWNDFDLTVLDERGRSVFKTSVDSFDAQTGSLRLTDDLPRLSVGGAYELTCNLEAPVIGIRYLLGLPLSAPVPPVRLRLGTTRGTNALLTRSGARTALVTTGGFGDLLDIGYQDRPQLFELTIRKPAPLIDCSLEVNERVSADGEVLIPLDESAVRRQLEGLRAEGIESVAVCLLHADLFPDHERRIAAIASTLGFAEISCSSEIAPLVKIVARAETTVVDAYLKPVLREYVAGLQRALPNSEILLMTSAGGLVAPTSFGGHESVLSGPAGGVVGYSRAAEVTGFDRTIGFDMGGTSTDVSRYDGSFEFQYESRKAGARLIAPTLAIETVAAGGGSICKFDGAKLVVGPASAGADPGPACYGRGGPLTVTDLNFFLGRIAPDHFPFALHRQAVERQLVDLAKEVYSATGEELSAGDLGEGLLKIANANMARAIRSVSIAKGVNPADYLMVAFGGAAAQHACAVARELGIQQILNHPDAGILSAYGIGQADIVRHAALGMAVSLSDLDTNKLDADFDRLAQEPTQQVLDAGSSPEQLDIHKSVDLRYEGTDTPLNLLAASEGSLRAAFDREHHRLFGYVQPDRPIEVVAARMQVVGKTRQSLGASESCTPIEVEPTGRTPVRFAGNELSTANYERADLPAGARVVGPAIVADQHSTIVIEPGWRAEVLSGGELLLTAKEDDRDPTFESSTSAAVMLEVFNNLFAGIAEQMGHVLRRTASSVNVKERLDYSCAVFTASGELIANAPHVPVHLGAMGTTVRAILAERPQMHAGDVYVTNDPYRGGSHLPDITVVSPVHDPDNGKLLFFTACRAHHAEIGGIRPGSMPPGSKHLGEEGVLISNFALIEAGVSHENELRTLLSSAPYPSRRVDENLADLRAQVAANRQGADDLLKLVEQYSFETLQSQVQGIQQAAETKVRQALRELNLGECEFTDYLETADGASVPICVQLEFLDGTEQPAAIIDFQGTAPTVAGNLNANRAIVTAAVLYVLRLLVDENIPLNEGALRAVEIRLPTCLLNPEPGDSPDTTPAVAAGNVETSQRVVDVLLGALGIAGASQGTMNNVLFGNESFGYYETIAGGSGATADGPGADAVQIHMTNTRATDPEILERRHPVRLWEFSIRHQSGGKGKHHGGDGVVRRLEFLEPLQVSLITGRRGEHPPYGAQGGAPGAIGENILRRANGEVLTLAGICEIDVEAGDELTIKTPGGGGFRNCTEG